MYCNKTKCGLFTTTPRSFFLIFMISIIYAWIHSPVIAQERAEEIRLSSLPSWLKAYPTPKPESNYKDDLVLVHVENQYNHTTKEFFWRYFYYLNTTEGRNKIKSFYFNYEPLYQSFQINKVCIHRNNNIIELKDQLHVESKLETKHIGGVFYDNNKEIKIFFNQAKVGDLIEIAYTIKGGQPDLHGILNYLISPAVNRLKGKSYFRILASDDKTMHYTAINNKIKAERQHYEGLSGLEFSFAYKQALHKPVTPLWYSNENQIYIFESNSWKEVSDLYLKHFETDKIPSDVVRNKVDELSSNMNALQDKINVVLDFIQKEIFYLDYGLIEPKKPETVLKQGFGDCKSKSLLGIKMLECLGVNAWPVIVKNTGLDDRFLTTYSAQIFNHCVLEFVYDLDTILFDPTLDPQKGNIYQKYVPDFRYGLRIIKNNTGLSKLKEHLYQKLNLTATISKSDMNNKNKVNWTIGFEGNLANKNNLLYNEKGIKEVFKTVSTDILKFNNIDPDNYELTYNQEEGQPKSELIIKPLIEIQVFEGNNNSTFYPRPLYEYFFRLVDSNNLGPCFSLPEFKEIAQLYKFSYSDWMNFQPDTSEFKRDWIEYNKKTWIENDTIYAFYTAKILQSDMDSSRYRELVNDIEFLRKDMELNFGENGDKFKKMLPAIFVICFVFLMIFSLTFTIWRISKNNKQHRMTVQSLNAEIERLKSEK